MLPFAADWLYFTNNPYKFQHHLGGVVGSVLASHAVDRGFEPRSGQIKYYAIAALSDKHVAFRNTPGWVGIGIMYTSGATYYLSDLALYKSI